MLPHSIDTVISQAKAFDRRVVLVTGVFDILHDEHTLFLQKAKKTGDVLVVGVESDKRVKELKGEDRPINPQDVRVAHLEQMHIADGVFVLPELFSEPVHHLNLLRAVRPDVLAVSSHTPHLQSKRKLIEEVGGRLEIVHQHNPEISTTRLLQEGQ